MLNVSLIPSLIFMREIVFEKLMEQLHLRTHFVKNRINLGTDKMMKIIIAMKLNFNESYIHDCYPEVQTNIFNVIYEILKGKFYLKFKYI